MHNYRELEVWKKAMDFVMEVYKITSNFPSEEKFGLCSQLKRAAVSIASNISEGAGRNSVLQFQNFLQISMGSCNEVATQIELAFRLDFIPKENCQTLQEESKRIYRMLQGLYLSLGK